MSVPSNAADLKSGACMLLDFGKGKTLGPPVVPAEPKKDAGVSGVGNGLLEIETVSNLPPARAIVRDDIGHGTRAAGCVDGVAVDPHPRVVDKC